MSRTLNPDKLKTRLIAAAHGVGFHECGFCEAQLSAKIGENLREYTNANHHGTMAWMRETLDRRAHPQALWPDAKSVMMLAMNYGPEVDPMAGLNHKQNAQISVYARHRDYHELVKGKLKQLAGKLAAWGSCEVKVFVDTAPVMEKPIAARAGLGWQGKHTNLVSRQLGSWFFLGAIFTDYEFAVDEAEIDHCGNCHACLDACPTNAFPAPYQIDARRCISYLTIEHKGPIPPEFRPLMANRIYGCDDCLAVCPWNKFAKTASEIKLRQRADLENPSLEKLAKLDDAQFRQFFSGSPIKRIGRNRFLRNVLIAMGNSRDKKMLMHVEPHLRDDDFIVRGAAVWAMRSLGTQQQIDNLRANYYATERDGSVRNEWDCDLNDA